MQIEIVCDIIITWVASFGVGTYGWYVKGKKIRSSLENRLLFLIICLFSLFLFRGFWWLTESTFMSVLSFIPATLLPLFIALFVEGLLRRHLPQMLKFYVAIGTVFFLMINFLGLFNKSDHLLLFFMVYELVLLAVLGALLLFRKRTALSAVENRFIDSVLIVTFLAIPLGATDFREEIGQIPIRLGSIGGLSFIYICIRSSFGGQVKKAIAYEIASILALSAFFAGSFFLVSEDLSMQKAMMFFALSVAFVLVVQIFEKVFELKRYDNHESFHQWLAKINLSSIDAFVESLRKLPSTADLKLVEIDPSELYENNVILKCLLQATKPLSKSMLKERAKNSKTGDLVLGYEQLIDILEKHGMSHVCPLTNKPLVLLLVHVPELVGAASRDDELLIIHKLSEALNSGGAVAQS